MNQHTHRTNVCSKGHRGCWSGLASVGISIVSLSLVTMEKGFRGGSAGSLELSGAGLAGVLVELS